MADRLALIQGHLTSTGLSTLKQHPFIIDRVSTSKRVRTVRLNNPKRLNCIQTTMFVKLVEITRDFESDDQQKILVYTGEGRAFCTGLDLTGWNDSDDYGEMTPTSMGCGTSCVNFHIQKDFVAIWNGIVMGGGISISFSANHRVVTENVRYAMPESRVGLFANVCGAYFLQLTKNIDGLAMSLYMSITGSTINCHDLVYTGLADHLVPTTVVGTLVEELENDSPADLDSFFKSREQAVDLSKSVIYQNKDWIEKIFKHAPTVEIIDERVNKFVQENPSNEFLAGVKAQIEYNSPLSMKVNHRLYTLTVKNKWSIEDVSHQELSIIEKMFRSFSNNISAGILANLGAEKDRNSRPKWDPPTLATVTDKHLDDIFSPEGCQEFDFYALRK
eukprot:CAMPEP_0114989646 /NCGR_PEP_ID=MMETSP0216-20121206/10317_1 /TAXON_ID=223996 /ORGANISM="Protocruzia adherens, Strain Boccale" /LENGTH=388 /DNA_ID=CAMNT_0002352655 /DNA_START=50 /DNA_END=1216 /DNA_ORIENTATION=-